LAQSIWENDLDRVRIAIASFVVDGALQLVAIARYSRHDQLDWPAGVVLAARLDETGAAAFSSAL
jgi:hypothetical protein